MQECKLQKTERKAVLEVRNPEWKLDFLRRPIGTTFPHLSHLAVTHQGQDRLGRQLRICIAPVQVGLVCSNSVDASQVVLFLIQTQQIAAVMAAVTVSPPATSSLPRFSIVSTKSLRALIIDFVLMRPWGSYQASVCFCTQEFERSDDFYEDIWHFNPIIYILQRGGLSFRIGATAAGAHLLPSSTLFPSKMHNNYTSCLCFLFCIKIWISGILTILKRDIWVLRNSQGTKFQKGPVIAS